MAADQVIHGQGDKGDPETNAAELPQVAWPSASRQNWTMTFAEQSELKQYFILTNLKGNSIKRG